MTLQILTVLENLLGKSHVVYSGNCHGSGYGFDCSCNVTTCTLKSFSLFSAVAGVCA